jgi:sugar lactone lactonase YvrE
MKTILRAAAWRSGLLPVLALVPLALVPLATWAVEPASGPATGTAVATPPVAASSPLQDQLARVRALQQQRPGDGLLVYYEALTLAQLGERAAALERLGSLLGRRLGLLPPEGAGFEALWEDPAFQALRRRLSDDEPRIAEAPVLHTLDDPRLIPEGIAHDARRGLHYVGSLAQRRILSVDARGRVREWSRPADRLDAVLGLAVDAPRDRLCAVSHHTPTAAGAEPRNSVLCWALSTRRLVARLTLPAARQLNDLAFAADGSVYLTDSAEGSLWHWHPGEPQARRVGEAGQLRGANGVAVAPDRAVYVAVSTGIARVDTSRGEAQRLPQPDSVVTGGIDGLYWVDGDLVGVQNGPNPGRVLRIHLADEGRRIAGLTVLQSHHHPAFAEPTTGVRVGTALHLVANSHIAQLQPDGSLLRPETLRPTRIVAVPLRR